MNLVVITWISDDKVQSNVLKELTETAGSNSLVIVNHGIRQRIEGDEIHAQSGWRIEMHIGPQVRVDLVNVLIRHGMWYSIMDCW